MSEACTPPDLARWEETKKTAASQSTDDRNWQQATMPAVRSERVRITVGSAAIAAALLFRR
jgi:hypothetical protein